MTMTIEHCTQKQAMTDTSVTTCSRRFYPRIRKIALIMIESQAENSNKRPRFRWTQLEELLTNFIDIVQHVSLNEGRCEHVSIHDDFIYLWPIIVSRSIAKCRGYTKTSVQIILEVLSCVFNWFLLLLKLRVVLHLVICLLSIICRLIALIYRTLASVSMWVFIFWIYTSLIFRRIAATHFGRVKSNSTQTHVSGLTRVCLTFKILTKGQNSS